MRALLLFVLLLFSVCSEVFSDSTQSIREMGEEIQTLEKEKEEIEQKWREFRIGGNSLGSYVREGLSSTEKDTIEVIVNNYIAESRELSEADFTTLQSLKEEFYSQIEVFIDVSKLELFQDFKNSELQNRSESYQVASEIAVKNSELQTRVNMLQEKIEENKQVLRKSIEEKLVVLVEQRLEKFISQDTFSSLSNDQKVAVFNKFVIKLDILIAKLEQNPEATTVVNEKIISYRVVRDIFARYINAWV